MPTDSRMKIIRGRLIISAILLVVVVAIAVFTFVQIRDRTYFHSPPYKPEQDKTSDVLGCLLFPLREYRGNGEGDRPKDAGGYFKNRD